MYLVFGIIYIMNFSSTCTYNVCIHSKEIHTCINMMRSAKCSHRRFIKNRLQHFPFIALYQIVLFEKLLIQLMPALM